MEECPRQRDYYVQRHRGGRNATFKGVTVSSIREENGG